MAQDVRTRPQKVVTFASGQQQTVDLSRGLVARYYSLRLKGQPTLTAPNNTLAKTLAGDEWAVIAKLELIENGSQVIRSLSGEQLWWLNYFMFGVPPQITPAIGDASTANPAFDSVLLLPMWMFNSVRPMDTALDTSKLSDHKLRITWGTFASINGDASAWTAEPSLEIDSCESAFLKDSEFSLQTVYGITQTIANDDPKLQIYLSTGDWYRAFLINTKDAGVDEGDILNNLKLKSGTTVFYDKAATKIQQEYYLTRGIHRPIPGSVAAGVYDALRRSAKSSLDGWYFVDLLTDGRLSESINTKAFSEFYLEADVSVGAGTTIMEIIPITVTPPRQ